MKTNTTIHTIIFLLFLLVNVSARSQDTFVSLVVGRDVSGSGLGGNVSPAISLTWRDNIFILGPTFQRRRMNFSGYELNYRRIVARSANRKFELYFAGNARYHFSGYMSRANVEIEQSCNKENQQIYAEMKLKVIEGYAGIGIKWNVVKQISFSSSVGVGMFNTLTEGYDREMFREKAAPALMIRAALMYNLRR